MHLLPSLQDKLRGVGLPLANVDREKGHRLEGDHEGQRLARGI